MADDIQNRKLHLVREILRNKTYLPESGVYQRLEEQLLRLSKDDLGCLNLILALKLDEARVKAMELASDDWARKNPGRVMVAEREEREIQRREIARGNEPTAEERKMGIR